MPIGRSLVANQVGETVVRASKWVLAGSVMLFVAAVSQAATAPKAKSIKLDPETIISGRQSTFLLSGALFGGMKGAIDRGDDVKTQAFAARAIARWAKTIPAMFPEGTQSASSKALANIWTDRAGFEAKAASYAAEADKLAAMAAAGDKAGFATQWTVVRGTCSACHDSYRSKDEKPVAAPAKN